MLIKNILFCFSSAETELTIATHSIWQSYCRTMSANKSGTTTLHHGLLCVKNGYRHDQFGNLCQAAHWYKEGVEQFREALKDTNNSQEDVEILIKSINHFLHRVKAINKVLEAVNISQSQDTRDNIEATEKLLVEHEDDERMTPATEYNGTNEKREGEMRTPNTRQVCFICREIPDDLDVLTRTREGTLSFLELFREDRKPFGQKEWFHFDTLFNYLSPPFCQSCSKGLRVGLKYYKKMKQSQDKLMRSLKKLRRLMAFSPVSSFEEFEYPTEFIEAFWNDMTNKCKFN